MVGDIVSNPLDKHHDILSDKQVHRIVEKCLGKVNFNVRSKNTRPASEGLAGFLGEHFKISLEVEVEGRMRRVSLFVKSVPVDNKPKADFITEGNFFGREVVMFKLFEHLEETENAGPWHVKAYIYSDSTLVMPDLSEQGYTTYSRFEYLDYQHLLIAATSVARLHASVANYETKRSLMSKKKYNILQEYGDILTECNFCDCPWLRASAKLTKNFIGVFSEKFKAKIPELESILCKLYIETTETLKLYEDSLNVVIHKDLWANNIMFKYVDDVPVNAILIDFQFIRYGPPAFDVMLMLYLNTSREFRNVYESSILLQYYCTFMNSVDDATKRRVKGLSYDYEDFLQWCERGRAFGALVAIGNLPYTQMDAETSDKIFNCPDTFERYTNEDRTEPVVAYAEHHKAYKDRLLEVFEEFVERYVVHHI